MKIKAFGCSFIWGSELSDEIPQRRFSDLTWSALLSKKLEIAYECFAQPGMGNLYIANEVMSQTIDTPDPAIFIINWTYIDRFDYLSKNVWDSILPNDDTDVAKFYFSKLHSEFRDKLTNLLTITNVINLLESKNIPYIMTNLDPIILDQRWNVTPAVMELQRQLKEKLTTFDQEDFLSWAKARGHAITERGHLLETGHLHVSREIEKCLNLGTINSLGVDMSCQLKQKLKDLHELKPN